MVQPRERSVQPLDAVQLAVITSRFKGIVKQMANTMFRTGRSGVINTAHDFSCCVITRDGEFMTMADSLPIHVMRSTDLQAQCMKEFHPDLKRGDAFIHNSPYHGNTHAGDWGIIVPVVDDHGVHQFTCVAKAHLSDIGNSIATTQFATAKDVYEEGALIFAATKVQEDYRDIDDIIRLLRLRIRHPDQFYGDYLAILGAVRTGERRILELAAEVGWETLHQYTRQWFDYSERMMDAAIRRMPSGRVTMRTTHDPFPGTDPGGVPLQATVEVKGEEGIIEVDLRDNPDCLPNGLNQSQASIITHSQIAIFNTVGHTVPTNAGSFRRIRVHLRENCCVGIPRHPHSCSMATTCLGNRIGGCVGRALAELGDGFGHAEVGPIQTPGFAIISGHDPRKNGPYLNQLLLGCAGGAAFPTVDGWVTIGDYGAMGMVHLDSIEGDEVQYPLYVYARSLIRDSGGAGRFRGAPGTYLEFGPIPGATMQAIYASDGTFNPAAGARGGASGGRASQFKRTADGQRQAATLMGPIHLETGEAIVCSGTGGGGYGSPLERDPERVRKDVAEGWISREAAGLEYGVVLDDAGQVLEDQTIRVRATKSRSA
jgi:N-methylhydantoinase B